MGPNAEFLLCEYLTAEEMKKVTGLLKSGRVDQTELYMVAKESI
jgi:hypothetical protein